MVTIIAKGIDIMAMPSPAIAQINLSLSLNKLLRLCHRNYKLSTLQLAPSTWIFMLK